ncbi:hypothetical protein BH10ACI1_BH10ACI1_10070 [soil metagenome]
MKKLFLILILFQLSIFSLQAQNSAEDHAELIKANQELVANNKAGKLDNALSLAQKVVDLSIKINNADSINGGVVNGKAKYLAVPAYPASARSRYAKGVIPVRVTINEEGTVISAKAICGDGDLRAVSEEAARQSKFSPTLLSGQPVKVTGIILYNFVP